MSGSDAFHGEDGIVEIIKKLAAPMLEAEEKRQRERAIREATGEPEPAGIPFLQMLGPRTISPVGVMPIEVQDVTDLDSRRHGALIVMGDGSVYYAAYGRNMVQSWREGTPLPRTERSYQLGLEEEKPPHLAPVKVTPELERLVVRVEGELATETAQQAFDALVQAIDDARSGVQ